MRPFLRYFFLLAAASLIVSPLTFSQNNWQTRSIPSIKSPINAMAVASNDNIYAATDGSGLYSSTNGGVTWTKINSGTMPSYYYSVAVDKNNNLYAGSYSGQVFISPDGGTTWKSSVVGIASAIVSSFSFGNGSKVYAGSDGEGMFVSADVGLTWTPIGTGINFPIVTSTLVDSRGHLLAGTYGDGVYNSNDQGAVWSWIGLIDYPAYYPSGNGVDTAAGVSGNFLRVNALVAGLGTRVFIGTDQGMYYDSLVIDSLVNDSTGKFIRLDTGRTDWFIDTVGTHHGRLFVQTMVATADGHIFAGTYGSGIYRSTNDGATWSRRDSIPATANVQSLAIDDSGYVYAGTTTGIIYRSTTPEPVSAPAPAPMTAARVPQNTPKLDQNYPNPFNPTTVIPFTLYKSGYTRLVIYDVLGREVTRLADGNLTAGSYQFEWNATAVPSGTYFYRLQSASATQTGKLILLK
jgi:photosystem II stability/assembly factor-like uncharacterized protein